MRQRYAKKRRLTPFDDDYKILIRKENLLLEQTSFLTPSNFAHIKSVYEAGGDHYALGQLQDPKLWQAISIAAAQGNQMVTDLYLSNIPELIEEYSPDLRTNLRQWVAALPGDLVTVYETGRRSPHSFKIERWPAEQGLVENCLDAYQQH